MPARQLIVCCDGTNNNLTGGTADTNVVKLLKWVGGAGQRVFYDPGVGNPGALPGATAWDKVRRITQRTAGLALGRGVYENIAEAYEFLMRYYEPGDELYFFGFSRGAFTARSTAGLVNQFGILDPHMQSMVPTLLHVYFSDRTGVHDEQNKAVAREIRENFCSPESRAVKIHFVGVWDTVASVGMWPFAARMTARPTIKGKRFVHVRQALALDEHRAPFKPRLYVEETDSGQSVAQRWFRGAHCDVGGGYPPDRSAISNEALAWLVVEAHKCGLRVDATRVPVVQHDAIREALGPGLIGRPPVIHSETYDNCLWAVAGLTVRQTAVVEVDGRDDIAVLPIEHDSVVTTPLAFPADSVWARRRPARQAIDIVVLAAVSALLFLGLGARLAGASYESLSAWLAGAPAYVEANLRFAQWQLQWALGGLPIDAFSRFDSPRWALVTDFFFIPAYATVLGWLGAKAFAKVARFTRAGDAPRPLLSMLGRALPCLVIADVAENALTLTLISMAPRLDSITLSAIGALMSVASAAKVLALFGVFVLLAWGYLFSPGKAEGR